MPLEYKSGSAEYKAEGDTGEFEGYFAITGNVDDGGDVIEPGAFKKTLAETGDRVKLFYQHDPKLLIGVPTHIEEDSRGLFVKGRLVLESFWGHEAWVLMKANALKEGSIGYNSIPARTQFKNGHRHMSEIILHEASPVSIGMNSATSIRALKEWTADGGNVGLYLEILQRVIGGMNTVIGAGGMDIDAADDVCGALDLVRTSLYGLMNEARETSMGLNMGLMSLDLAAQIKAAQERAINSIKEYGTISAELKAGRMISTTNMRALADAQAAMTTALETLQALIDAATPDEPAKALDHLALQIKRQRIRLAEIEFEAARRAA